TTQGHYQLPLDSTFSNGHLLEKFPLSRGTCQGCPLSPLLYSVVTEPIAQSVSNILNIQEINIKKKNINWHYRWVMLSYSLQN
uniref:Reverse transcriptase domain-containing protein n=1 Tax=Crocodylus porosus TaxID=8502 RepID=A0A7M4FX78_CROPO